MRVRIRRGSYNLFGIATIPAIMGLGAISADVSYVSLVNDHTSASANEASRTALIVFRETGDAFAAEAAAVAAVAANPVGAGQTPTVAAVDFGEYTSALGFNSGASRVNSARVDLDRTGNGAVGLFLAPIFGVSQVELSNEATSASEPRNFVVAHDIGASWKDDIDLARGSIEHLLTHMRARPFPEDSVGVTAYVADAGPTVWMPLDDIGLNSAAVDTKISSFDLCNCTGDFFDNGDDIPGVDLSLDYASAIDVSDVVGCTNEWNKWDAVDAELADCELAVEIALLIDDEEDGDDVLVLGDDGLDADELAYIEDLDGLADDLGIVDIIDVCDISCPVAYCGSEFGGYNANPDMPDCHEIGAINLAEADPGAVHHAPAITQAHDELMDYASGRAKAHQSLVLVVDDSSRSANSTLLERNYATIAAADVAEDEDVDVYVIMYQRPGATLALDVSFFDNLVRGRGRSFVVTDFDELDAAYEFIADDTPIIAVQSD